MIATFIGSEAIVGIILSVLLMAAAILIAGPYAVEIGIRRALPNHLLRPDGEATAPKEPTACLECGTQMGPGDDACPKCGWTYAR